jgi:hypothetical protein
MTMDKMPKGLRHGQRNHSLVLEESTFYSVLLSASLLENYEQLKVVLI